MLKLKELNYETIKEALGREMMVISFTKIDGERRDMTCTLQDKFIPETNRPKGTGAAKSHDTISAYDIEAQGWRSFRVANVIEARIA